MYPLREKFLKRDKQGGVWTYASTFAVVTMALEGSRTDNFPVFIKGIGLEEAGQTTITVAASAYTFDSTGKVQLPHGNVFAVRITAPAGAPLTQGTAFTIDRANGIVNAMPGGAITAGETVQIAYAFAEEILATASQTAPTN
jgi:hypothetical protein